MYAIQGTLTLTARFLLSAIFLLSAVGNKIPNFQSVAHHMGSAGIPEPELMLVGAIVFLLVGSVSVALGFYARFGALLLSMFLVLATYYFHNFWALEGEAAQQQQIQFMKNLSMFGAMLFIIANGSGAFSLDRAIGDRQNHLPQPSVG